MEKNIQFLKNEKTQTILLHGMVVLFVLLYTSLIFNVNIWTDEAFTIQITRFNNYLGIIEQTAQDVHPPFYYFIVEFIVNIFGESLQVYKIISIVAMLCTMLLMVNWGRKLFGFKVAVLSVLWLNAIPSVMEYSVQVRSYAWLIFFMTAAGLAGYSIYLENKMKHWIILTLACIAACYIHTFAMFAAIFLYLCLLAGMILKHRTKNEWNWLIRFFVSGGCVAIAFSPWLFVLYNQTASRVDNYHFDPVTPQIVMNYFPEIFGDSIPFMATMIGIIMLISFVVLFVSNTTKEEKGFAICAYLIPLLTCTVGVLVSILLTPFFVSRYIACCLGLVSIAISIGLSKLNNKTLYIAGIFLVLLVGVSYKNNYDLEYKTAHTKEFLTFMDENVSENDIIIYNYERFGFIYECYFDTDKLVFVNDLDYSNSSDTMWFMDSCVVPWIDEDALRANGWVSQFVGTFDIEHNQFLLYKIFRQ